MNATPIRSSSFLTVMAIVALLVGLVSQSPAQIPALPEPPILLYGTVTDQTNNQPVTISSVTWQVTDGTTNRSYSAATLPATRIIANGQSFYLLEVPQETRMVQDGAGPISLQPGGNGFEVKSPAPRYTLTPSINGFPAAIRSVDNASQTPGTTSATLSDYTPAAQGRMLKVDLWINEDGYSTWAAAYFTDQQSPAASQSADPDGDGATNRQEWAAGTHPLDPRSTFTIRSMQLGRDGSVIVRAATVPGKRYQLESSDDLMTFHGEGQPFTATAVQTEITTIPGGARKYFRLATIGDP